MEKLGNILQRIDPGTFMGKAVAELDALKEDFIARVQAGEQLPSWEKWYEQWLAEKKEREPVKPEPFVPDGGPYCGRCSGTRWLVMREYPDGAPILPNSPDFAALRKCPDCIDVDRAHVRQALAAHAGISPHEQKKTFATLESGRLPTSILQAVAGWARNPEKWLHIYGVPGSGKTHLALASANAIIARGERCIYRYVPDLVREARLASKHDTLEQLEALMASSAPVILDDLGAVPLRSEFVLTDFIEPLTDVRYRRGLPTFWTSIGSSNDIRANVSDSVGRRLQDTTLCITMHNSAPQYKPVEGSV